MRPKLMTSNLDKIKEFARLGIDADIGGQANDLHEALAHPWFVAAHKAHLNGTGALCEDTRLDVEGADIGIEARFLIDELPKLIERKAVFSVCLALCLEDQCQIWEGSIFGRIIAPQGTGFGFDPFFSPDTASGLSLGQLAEIGRKDEFSARTLACLAFRNDKPVTTFTRTELAAYNGPWQNESHLNNRNKNTSKL